MKEVLLTESASLLQIPKGQKMFGVVLPCSTSVNKDGVAVLKQKDAWEANRRFRIGRVLGQYTEKYGEHVFYLGTFQNPSGGRFRLFSFPIKHNDKEDCDSTIVSRSCQDLVSMCDRYEIECCLLPDLDMDYQAFYNCVKPLYDLAFDDRFILIHRKDKFND